MFEGIATGFSQLPLAPEPVNPDQSPDYLAGLRDFAGQFLTGCIVLVVISAIVSVTLFVIGKMTALSNAQAKSLMWSGRVFLGAAIIGSVGGLIFWGSGLGKFNLMPAGAQQPTVEITKKPAKSTCASRVELGAGLFNQDDIAGAVKSLLSDEDSEKYKNTGSVIWLPKGPQCTSENHVADPCSKVEVYAGGSQIEVAPRNTSECKN
ncbi:hypothetical protein GU243_23670 (plasmid) [Pseudarthrobacter psychrotolerans]|uniref:Uncharacterized protein n=1 Tax=Pseudarthrobacter psychrotolerans TaxID=2697569 RepID=A0A6P1ND14_9MICC|nr:hypothetical protein [Pseudarthrobacter psychrotolerans]QHK18465.1 hypothetical protein GU243_00155 [Pseudarthrobacter psychrotolerans]QHK22567.1 hypothetical protein GU243_23670 [Pseudarthrobacter psychrotolerans]